MFGLIRSLFRDRRAATAVEYGLIMALVVLALMGSLRAMAGASITMWNTVSEKVTTAQ